VNEYLARLSSSDQLTHEHLSFLAIRFFEHHLTNDVLDRPPPLLLYCAKHWHYHVHNCSYNEAVGRAALVFLTSTKVLELVTQFGANWLSSVGHAPPLSKAIKGTISQRFLEHENFVQWEHGVFRVLYCSGIG
jgi:hypothetical protein